MSSSRVVNVPTSVGSVPTSDPLPAVLMRTCSRSGKDGAGTVRVKNVSVAPFTSVAGGVSSQLLIVARPAPLLKLAPMYALGAPWWAGNTVELPWNQAVVPTGALLLS